MNLFIRMSGDLPFVEKAFFRNLIAFFVALSVLIKNKTPLKPEKKAIPLLFTRAACGTVGLLCNFYAVDHLLLSDASMLNKMSPFFAMIFSMIFLREKSTPTQFTIIAIALAGAAFIVKPTFGNIDLFPSFIGLLGGAGAGAAYTAVRGLSKYKVKGPVIVIAFSTFSCVVLLPIVILQFKMFTLEQFVFLMLTGIAASVGQFAITAAYTYAPASEISVYDYTQVIFSAVLGYFIFAQIPDGFSILGYAVIIGAALMMFFYNKRRASLSAAKAD